MKRILIIDESEVVRETLALILGREFAVSKRALGAQGLTFADTQNDFDLLILGISLRSGSEALSLARFAAQLPFAVLFLVDSKSAAREIQGESQVACLSKPFNPYDLHEKVGELLAQRSTGSEPFKRARKLGEPGRYLEFPYLSRSAATLVSRLATARLPLLVTGEVGCGQDRIAAALQRQQIHPGFCATVNAAEADRRYLSSIALQLSMHENVKAAPITLLIQNLDRCSFPAQFLLDTFLQEIENKFDSVRFLSTTNGDLLERVYRGEFYAALYYKLATLTLKLPPLRERREDIPVLAAWFARSYAKALGLGEPHLTPQAASTLSNYLWFGNLSELETVIARTLTLRRKTRIDAPDLVFDFAEPAPESEREGISELAASDDHGEFKAAEPQLQPYTAPGRGGSRANGKEKAVDLNLLIHELAHELKNPMVTIKTFAQLLADRYQDENFRTRFQEVVAGDIERMDDLLEMLIEFADFHQPRNSVVALDEKLRATLAEIHGECAKRQARVEWEENGAAHAVKADETHLAYILKNVLLAAVSQSKIGGEIRIDISGRGALNISYLREGARVVSIAHYLEKNSPGVNESILPLRVLLARHLLERNGGKLDIDESEGEREIVKMEFPIAEHG